MKNRTQDLRAAIDMLTVARRTTRLPFGAWRTITHAEEYLKVQLDGVLAPALFMAHCAEGRETSRCEIP